MLSSILRGAVFCPFVSGRSATSLLCAVILGTSITACAGDDDDSTAMGATATIESVTTQFDAVDCEIEAGEGGQLYRLLCEQQTDVGPRSFQLSAPVDTGSYEGDAEAGVMATFVDPEQDVSVISYGTGGACTILIEGTAEPGAGHWQGAYELSQDGVTVTGGFDVPIEE